MKRYSVRHWDRHFETCETRKLRHLDWWPKPNKHDGLGFRRLAAQKNKVELYCAWNLICDIASKSGKETRGKLERDGQPLTASDMACMTGFPEAIFEQAFTFFSSEAIGWLELAQSETPGESPAIAGELPGLAGQSPAEGKGREGKEENGIEEKGKALSRFIPPTWEEVQFHAIKIGLPETEALKFWSHYGSNGWRVGKNPMKDWHCSIGGWKVRWESERGKANGKPDHRTEKLFREGQELIMPKPLT